MTDKKFKKERKSVARFMRRLYERGLTTASGGNISIRIDDNVILITPTATDKGRMRWNDVGIMTMKGENLTPDLRPSIESGMHLSIYRKREDIKAIVHAHPAFASSFTATRSVIDTTLTAEATAILGKPVIVPYALMGTADLAEAVSAKIDESKVLLLENHGILTASSGLLEAFDMVEVLENAARMTLIVEITRKKSPLSKNRIIEIEKLFRS
ncbi:MAG TPA: class II aldolase/adducin family protein [Bacteroidales bacterium]|nr:class II aldolase/adducin family protein [Bacteroidales bacterium]